MSPDKHSRLARLAFAGALAALALPLLGSAASSGGGTTIANAPTIQSGQRVFGNTASEATVDWDEPCIMSRVQWWTLQAKAGDLVQIEWDNPAPAAYFHVCVFTANATDATIDQARRVLHAGGLIAHSGGGSFVAPATGRYPLFIGDHDWVSGRVGQPGPYSILVEIRHKALVYVPRLTSVRLAGQVLADVRTPGGEPITDAGLKLSLVGIWKDKPHLPPSAHVLSTASPVKGVAALRYLLPRKLAGTKILLRVTGGGPDYQPVASTTRKVQVRR